MWIQPLNSPIPSEDACSKASSSEEIFPERRAWIRRSFTGQTMFRAGSFNVGSGTSRSSLVSALRVVNSEQDGREYEMSVLLVTLFEFDNTGQLDAVQTVIPMCELHLYVVPSHGFLGISTTPSDVHGPTS